MHPYYVCIIIIIVYSKLSIFVFLDSNLTFVLLVRYFYVLNGRAESFPSCMFLHVSVRIVCYFFKRKSVIIQVLVNHLLIVY